MDSINKWLETKSAHLRILNQKVDFTKKDQVRENEIWMPLVSLKAGTFTDQGFRFRQNRVPRDDHWLPGVGDSIQKFYDVTFYSSDVLAVGPNFMTIAEMYFRIHSDSREYHKSQYSIINFLSDYGGVELLLTQILMFVFGSFIQFNGFISTLDNMEIPDTIDVKNPNPLGLNMIDKIKKDLQTKLRKQEIEDIMECNLLERMKIYMMLQYNCFDFVFGTVKKLIGLKKRLKICIA